VSGVIDAVAIAVAALSAAGALVGAWAWWQVRPSRGFWLVARTAQASAAVLAVTAGVAGALGKAPDGSLFWVYSLVPVGVSFVAEQLRIASAETVLEKRGLETTAAVGELPEAAQHSVVLSVVRREMGIMTAALAVICFLALRALQTV